MIIINSKKQAPVLDLVNYTKQHNIAVDMVCVCIMSERVYQREPKAIILSNAYFGIFQKWVKDNYGEETAEKQFFIDTVEIRKETIYSGKSLMIEYYPKAKAEA